MYTYDHLIFTLERWCTPHALRFSKAICVQYSDRIYDVNRAEYPYIL